MTTLPIALQIEMFLRVIFACFLGGLIGWERERHGITTAGIRTYGAIALGSCSFGLIAFYIAPVNPSQMTAQIISGIGFLGGGIIFRQGDYVTGLTTAATLWATSAVGLAVAFGMYMNAVLVSALLFLLLYLPRLQWWKKVSRKSFEV